MEYRIRQGGLMRCCIASVQEYMEETRTTPEEGTIIHCRYEKSADNGRMIFREGAWEWNRPKDSFTL